MDRFWQRPGNSNTSLSLSVALSHIDTTDAAEIPWYFFDASVVYFNPYCQKPVQLAGGNFSYFNKVCGLQTKIKFLEEKKDPANIGLCWSVYKDFIMYTQTVSVQDKLLSNGPKNFPYWPLRNRVLSVFMLLDKYLGKTHREQENLLQRSQYCCNCAMLYIDSSVASVQYPNPFTKQASSMMGKSNYWLSKMKAQLP